MDETIIRHIDSKYKVVIEKAASTKGVIGIKCEANGDSLGEVLEEAQCLFEKSITFTGRFSNPTDTSS